MGRERSQALSKIEWRHLRTTLKRIGKKCFLSFLFRSFFFRYFTYVIEKSFFGSQLIECSKAEVHNLGYAYPRGYVRNLKGYAKFNNIYWTILKKTLRLWVFLGVRVHKKVGNHCPKVFGTFWRTAIDEEEHSGSNFEIVDDKLRTSWGSTSKLICGN